MTKRVFYGHEYVDNTCDAVRNIIQASVSLCVSLPMRGNHALRGMRHGRRSRACAVWTALPRALCRDSQEMVTLSVLLKSGRKLWRHSLMDSSGAPNTIFLKLSDIILRAYSSQLNTPAVH